MLMKNHSAQQQTGSKQLVDEMHKIYERISKAGELLLSQDIDPLDYRTIKTARGNKPIRLEAKLAETAGNTDKTVSIDKLIDKVVSTRSNLDILYSEVDVARKREIRRSIYPEELSSDGLQNRTPRINEAVRLIYQITNELGVIKNRKDHDISHLSGRVARRGIEPLLPE